MLVNIFVHRVAKLVTPLASNAPNLVCSLWISMTYCTLHCLNIAYGHTHYDVCTLPCVLSVMSLFILSLHAVRCY